MASTACFFHHNALTTPARTPSQRFAPGFKPPAQVACRAQKQAAGEEERSGAAAAAAAVSRRLALTVLIGAAAVGSKVSPADAAYGEAGTDAIFPLPFLLIGFLLDCHCCLVHPFFASLYIYIFKSSCLLFEGRIMSDRLFTRCQDIHG